ncbi:hypothetical protein EK904_011868 [Melospiza melodia maxima]|nr:hypothetical protein EK904_011868 [Melospiza melodia maxima]
MGRLVLSDLGKHVVTEPRSWVCTAAQLRQHSGTGASLLSPTEAGGKKLRSTVQRSTETGLAVEMRNWMTRQASRESTDGSMNSYSSEGNLIFPGVRLAADSQFSDFLDGLGPAQLVGRQTLATPSMGDIQVGMMDKKGQLEVEIIRARGLVIIVWGDYGRMDHKSFMGVAQILLDELDLSNMFGYATETELPSHGATLQVSGLADIGRKEESKDDGKVNWHLQQLLEI